MKKITINNKEYKFKIGLRTLFMYERITQKPFKIESLLDNYVLFYSALLANNLDDCLSWDEFIDALDENPNLYTQIQEILNEEQKRNELFDVKNTDEKKN